MSEAAETSTTEKKTSASRRWIRRAFLTWAVVSTAWLANSVRTQGVSPELLKSSPAVAVADQESILKLIPSVRSGDTALIFFCGSGIAAEAYVPLLHPIAEAGFSVHIVRLPYRFAPLDSHRQQAAAVAVGAMGENPDISRWIISGHSLGAAIACQLVQQMPSKVAGMVLLGTTHPKQDDLSAIPLRVTKVYATNDGVAPAATVRANQRLLPATTTWVEIQGGNHSQFGHYGHQLFDGSATVTRSEQQRIARESILDALRAGQE